MSQSQPESPSARAARATEQHLAQFGDEDMAYHEAGHAVVIHLNGGTVKRLSIERADPRRGTESRADPAHTGAAKGDDPRRRLDELFAVLVGGDVAAALHGTPEQVAMAGARVDYEQALRAAAEAGLGTDEARAMIDAAWQRVRDRLREPAAWRLVESLAQELARRKTMDAEQIRAVLTQ